VTTIRITAADFLAETHIYTRLHRRGVTIQVDDHTTLVPSTPPSCEACEDGSDHGSCRWVRGLVLELERVTAERDALLDARP